MASIDWKKLKGGSMTSAMISHATRHDMNDVEYRNTDIDTSKTNGNYTVGGGLPWTSQTLRVKLDQRVAELDKIKPPKRVRSDRVTTIAFVVPAPRGLSTSQNKAFFKMAHEEVAKTCGGRKNASAGFVHVDEKHMYKDAMSGKELESLEHMHMFGVPWTDEHGINGKHFMTRERMRDLNKRIDERCREMFHMPYLTGEKGRSGLSVDDLKKGSAKMELAELENSLLEANIQLYEVNSMVDEKKSYLGELERYKAMEEWLANHYYEKSSNGVNYRVSLLDDFKKAYKKSQAKDKSHKREGITH